MTPAVAPLPDVVDAVTSVADPELPGLTLGMLGVVHDVVVDGGHVHVELLPTFVGCPATEMMERDVVAAARRLPGVETVTVRFRYDPPWTPDRIDAAGREQLRAFGIAPPGGTVPGALPPPGRAPLPLVLEPDAAPRACPFCGSLRTVRESRFGPTPCRDVRFCDDCQQPFEAFRS